MVKAKVKQKGTTFEDIFLSVPLGSENSESARGIWLTRFNPSQLSYDTYNRILTKLFYAEHNGESIVKRRRSGVSYLYWRELKEFPVDVRFIE